MTKEKKPRKRRVTKAEFARFQKALREEPNEILEALQKRRASEANPTVEETKPAEENPFADEKDFVKNAKEYWHKG